MAQWRLRSRIYEGRWRPALNLAAKILRGFQDRWQLSNSTFPSRGVSAVLLNVFAFDFLHSFSDELELRSLDEWLQSVGSPETELDKLCPNRADSEIKDAVEFFCGILSDATELLECNSATAPSTDVVVRDLAKALSVRGFLKIHID
jgi:hypothetical protein